jgi:two-component system, OmpR family, alkaline phosphatase synthesis response regulator PhoP
MDKRIVLIEDDDLIRELYLEEFNSEGLHTEGFATGKAGLDAIRHNHYDLLLLDMMLPDTNGLLILKELKSDPATKDLKVVVLTNLGQETVQNEATQLGALGYLIKLSYTPDEIIQEVRKYLGMSSESTSTPL